MNEEKNQKILAVVLVIAVVVLGVYKLFFNKDKSNSIDTKTVNVVSDINEFYTVSNCVDKLFMYINIEDKDNILVLLSKEYKKKNGLPILDAGREEAILEKVGRRAGPELAPYARRVYETVLAVSREYQAQRMGGGK